jgi:methyl coenzyme M reductase subunit D
MKIETEKTIIDVFPIRRVRITITEPDTDTIDEFHRVCRDEVTIDYNKIIGMDQEQTTLVLEHMRHSNTDVVGNGKDFYMVRGNNLIPIYHYSFSKL